MKAVIMAGGKGTRIQSVRRDIPKPMIPLSGRPILQHQIECLRENGIRDITIGIGYLGHVIRDYFGDGTSFGVNISYFEEQTPLGTAGALFRMPDLKGDFIVLCADTIFDIDFSRFISFHKEHSALATLLSHPNSHPYDSSLLVTEILPPDTPGGLPRETRRVVRWLNKEDERLWYKNRVNAGIEIINSALLDMTRSNLKSEKVDLDRDVLKPAVACGGIFAYDTSEYIKDMGTPDRLKECESDIERCVVKARNLSRPQRAVFLDRDGTLNEKAGFVKRAGDIRLIPGAAEAVRRINQSGRLAIVVTNQPQIARGEITFEELYEINNALETLLGREGAYIDSLYFCPHHPDKGFPGERLEYKTPCDCRKPAPGLLLRASRDFNIDLSQSVMIGDSERDIEAGRRAGCRESFMLTPAFTLKDCVERILP